MNLENKYTLTLTSILITLLTCLILPYLFIQVKSTKSSLSPVVLGATDSTVTIYLGEGFLNPGFFEVSSGLTVKDILELYENNIDLNTYKIDLSQKVTDGLKLDFKAQSSSSQDDNPVDKKDINLATVSDLDKISGIGPVTAAAIFEYVKSNGPITNLNDLDNVKGVGEKTLEEIRKYYE